MGITAGCYYVSEVGALIIGVVSGLVVYFGTLLLEKLKLDDVVGAIPVHGFSALLRKRKGRKYDCEATNMTNKTAPRHLVDMTHS